MKKLIGKLRQLARKGLSKSHKWPVKARENLLNKYEHGEYYAMVNRLTNWQRSQWARAGYPGSHFGHREAEKVEPFTKMVKP